MNDLCIGAMCNILCIASARPAADRGKPRLLPLPAASPLPNKSDRQISRKVKTFILQQTILNLIYFLIKLLDFIPN